MLNLLSLTALPRLLFFTLRCHPPCHSAAHTPCWCCVVLIKHYCIMRADGYKMRLAQLTPKTKLSRPLPLPGEPKSKSPETSRCLGALFLLSAICGLRSSVLCLVSYVLGLDSSICLPRKPRRVASVRKIHISLMIVLIWRHYVKKLSLIVYRNLFKLP